MTKSLSDKKIVKLAVLRSDDSEPNLRCPFGLSIPSACQSVGKTISQMFPLDQLKTDEEKEDVKKSNNFLARWQSTGEKCIFAGQIIKHDVNCNFGQPDTGVDVEKAPFASPFYPKTYNNTAYDGVFTAPIGYYADYDAMRNSYYGLYSLQGRFFIQDIQKFAGKIDDLKKKYPELSNDIEEFSNVDLSKNNKYLEWMTKQLKAGFKKEDIIPTVQLFHKHVDKLEKKDINQYGTVKDLENVLKNTDLSSKTNQKRQNKENGKKIFEDDQYVLIRPDDKNACVTYGKNTKWCITMQDATYYENYKMNNVVFYFLINKKQTGNPQAKLAFAVLRGPDNSIEDIEIYDAEDNKLDLSEVQEFDFEYFLNLVRADAKTIPKSLLAKLSSNEELKESELDELVNNEDGAVREFVAEKLPKKYLYKMVNDPSSIIRSMVAARLPPEYDHLMVNDSDPGVLREIATTIDYKYFKDLILNQQAYPGILGKLVERLNENQYSILFPYLWENNYFAGDSPEANHLRRYMINGIQRSGNKNDLKFFINEPNPRNRYFVANYIPSEYLDGMYKNEIRTYNSMDILSVLEERMSELDIPWQK